MPKRVIHGEIGGAEQHVLNLLQFSAREGVAAELLCLVADSPFAALTESLGIRTAVLPMRFALDLLPVRPIVKLLDTDKIDLIHCHGTRANLVGRLSAKISSRPCISTYHSLPETDYSSPRKGRLALGIDNLTLPLGAGFITVSAYLQKDLAHRLAKKGLHKPCRTIYNGLAAFDFSHWDQMRRDFRTRWNIPVSCKLIGTIGRLHPVKGHLYLIEALKLLNQDFSDLHLLLIGEGREHQALEELLISYGIPYTLTGYLPDAWKALPAMDIFVLPSLSEGMGLVLLEAAQAGIPIVASAVGGIPELLKDNTEALLIQPGNPVDLTLACSRLLRDQALVQRLTLNARRRAEMFTIDQMLKDTASFYHAILEPLTPAQV